MTRDIRAEYEAAIAHGDEMGGGFYPAVAVDTIDGFTHLVCANGHRWGSINPLEGCPTCIRKHNFRRNGRVECIEPGCDRLVECSDRAYEAGVRKCIFHWTDDGGWTAGPISVDDGLRVLQAQYMPRNRWNGWLMPWLDAWSCQQIIEQFALDGQEDYYEFEWREDGVLVLTQKDGEDRYVEELHPDEDGLYALGAGSWVWTEWDQEEES